MSLSLCLQAAFHVGIDARYVHCIGISVDICTEVERHVWIVARHIFRQILACQCYDILLSEACPEARVHSASRTLLERIQVEVDYGIAVRIGRAEHSLGQMY